MLQLVTFYLQGCFLFKTLDKCAVFITYNPFIARHLANVWQDYKMNNISTFIVDKSKYKII